MNQDSTVVPFPQPETIDDPLTAVLRAGACRLLAQAIEAEVDAFLAAMAGQRLADGRARFVRPVDFVDIPPGDRAKARRPWPRAGHPDRHRPG